MSATDPEPGLQVDWPTAPAGPSPPHPGPFAFLKELPALIIIAFGVALLLKTLLIQAFYIPSPSMEPTLVKNDRILVNKFAYRFREPRRGEVIVFIKENNRLPRSLIRKVGDFLVEGLGVTTPPEKDFVKRIIGLPGDTVRVTEKAVYVKPAKRKRFRLVERYVDSPGRMGPPHAAVRLKPGTYWVMGDNRENSSDSRFFGPIKRSDIIGKVFVRIWPPKRADLIEEPVYSNDTTPGAPEGKAAGHVPAMPPVAALVAALAIRPRRA